MVAGAAAGITAQLITYPGDTVRKCMIVNGANGAPPMYKSSWVRLGIFLFLFCFFVHYFHVVFFFPNRRTVASKCWPDRVFEDSTQGW